MRGFARVCRVEDSEVNALTRAIGVRGLEKSPRSLKGDSVGPVLCRHVSPAVVPAAGVIVPRAADLEPCRSVGRSVPAPQSPVRLSPGISIQELFHATSKANDAHTRVRIGGIHDDSRCSPPNRRWTLNPPRRKTRRRCGPSTRRTSPRCCGSSARRCWSPPTRPASS